jgi:uncharacterized protein (TIGR04255 family)
MSFEPSKFVLVRPPLAVVLAQFGLRSPISDESVNLVRKSLHAIRLDRAMKKHERSVSFNPPSIEPKIQDLLVYNFLDSANTQGVSVAGSTVSCFASEHHNFSRFVDYLSSVVAAISVAGIAFDVTSIALRYINVFEADGDPATVVKRSLRGLDHANLGKEHHHHNYEFWCDTDEGRLTVRFSTMHGDQKPAQIGHAVAVFPSRCLRSYDVMVGHLDIFANTTRSLNPPISWEASKRVLQAMNRNIEQAFLNAIDETALIEKFGATRSDKS